MADADLQRSLWVAEAVRMARPLLDALALRGFSRDFDPQGHQPAERARFAALEACARLLNGVAPWLDPTLATDPDETALRDELRALALRTIDAIADPNSADFANWAREGSQPLVDAAFLAQAFLRAPKALWVPLSRTTQQHVLSGMRACRSVDPGFNNWLLFAAMVEAFLHFVGEPHDPMRVSTALRFHSDWYRGDGIYGDGPQFRHDHYNSFVIQPMLLDILRAFPDYERFHPYREPVFRRAQRYAVVQERLVSPEGTYPPLGRSITYRTGAFHHLAHLAWREDLPGELPPAQVRCALTAVLQRSLGAPGTYAPDGFLTIGFCGNQPSLGESYISRASAYLASFVFLPLGLPKDAPFWFEPDTDWTARQLYQGLDQPPDKALSNA